MVLVRSLMVTCLNLQASISEVFGVVEAKGEEEEQVTEQLQRLLFILHTLVSHRDGAKITKPEAVCQVRGEESHKNLRDGPKVRLVSNPVLCSPLQTVMRLIQSSALSASCSRLLLQISSSLLLGENVRLPRALIQELVQKVGVC